MDGEGARISLASGNVVYIKKNGKELTPNTDETLWFSVENPTGKYTFEIKTVDGNLYKPVLDWTQPGGEE